MNFFEVKGILLNNKVTAFLLEKIMDIIDICKYIVTGSYAQEKEDLIAREILTNIFGKELNTIIYMDVGANKWRHGNNTYLFYEKCQGILVEADPILAEKLRQKRKKDIVYNIAVGMNNERISDFHIMSLGTRSSLNEEYIEQEKKKGIKVLRTIQIKCRTISSLLEENKVVPDLLSIDIEGMDFQVLQTINYEKYKIKVVIAEKSDEKNINNESMDQFMKRQGYIIHCITKSNIIYRLNNIDL